VTSRFHKKMTKKEYLKNTGLDAEYDVVLKSIYDSVKGNPLPVNSNKSDIIPEVIVDSASMSPIPSIVLFSEPLIRKNLTRGYSKAKNRRFAFF
jgi:hypothetical protein